MVTIQRINVGPRMSAGVVHNGTVYLAGQVATKTAGRSVSEQTAEILQQIDDLLAAAGADKTKLLTAHIFIVDMATFGEMNAVWDKWVSPGNTPARTTIEAKLAGPQYAVEITATAAI